MKIKDGALRDTPFRNIILIGPRGAGKTSVGRELAHRLGAAFVDTDIEIQHRVGMPISRFVSLHGWEKFRRIESLVVKDVTSRNAVVIACGGGVPLDLENRTLLQKSGMVVYLFASVPTLLRRINGDTHFRPPLKEGMESAQEMEAVFLEREHIYKECSVIAIDTTLMTLDQVCTHIINQVSKKL